MRWTASRRRCAIGNRPPTDGQLPRCSSTCPSSKAGCHAAQCDGADGARRAAVTGGEATAIDRAALANRTTRITAPDPIQPTGTVNADEAWAALERSREQLFGLLEAAEGRDLTQITRPHPVLGLLDGYQWIAAIGGHEERHMAQIEEIAALFEGQGTHDADEPLPRHSQV